MQSFELSTILNLKPDYHLTGIMIMMKMDGDKDNDDDDGNI